MSCNQPSARLLYLLENHLTMRMYSLKHMSNALYTELDKMDELPYDFIQKWQLKKVVLRYFRGDRRGLVLRHIQIVEERHEEQQMNAQNPPDDFITSIMLTPCSKRYQQLEAYMTECDYSNLSARVKSHEAFKDVQLAIERFRERQTGTPEPKRDMEHEDFQTPQKKFKAEQSEDFEDSEESGDSDWSVIADDEVRSTVERGEKGAESLDHLPWMLAPPTMMGNIGKAEKTKKKCARKLFW
ncbi:Protein CBG25823 [Caenorhabditis briggsae]|uniref:Uncharacterized protein n=2 Tax=Caenorhabditis briggsae TaxID=6238 RepID=A0AAE9D9D1_CAEBR|nr:Protein CBG25823 [Caenorhabditis briggsae]ULT99071.1 hypothetical protein L3Y34_000429 [Caenorhabditis briggsae]CAS00744.1 Protein CBG25823 [Caenorhabditis briggsae]